MVSRNMIQRAGLPLVVAMVFGTLGACTANLPSASPPATAGGTLPAAGVTTTSTTPSAPPSDLVGCTESSIKGALTKGSAVVKFNCTITSPAMWAAVRVKTGSVFFLTSVSGPWQVTPGQELCGVKIKKVPKELRDYCK